MSDWNQESIRKAAAWQAFKEGAALCDGGAVREVARIGDGWRGVVMLGKRALRVSVTPRSATEIDSRCGCRENQESGAFCAHAVAVALAASGRGPALRAAPTPAAADQPADAASAWSVRLPPNWREGLRRGALAPTLELAGEAAGAADLRLGDWLGAARPERGKPLHLHLDRVRLAEFLDRLTDHPRVTEAGSGRALTLSAGLRLPVLDASPDDDTLRLAPDGEAADWLCLDGAFWRIDGDQLARLGTGRPPPEIDAAIHELVHGKAVRIALAPLLARPAPWQEWIAFPPDGWLESLHFVPAEATYHLALDGSLDGLDATIRVAYHSAPPVVPGAGEVAGLPGLRGGHCETRDLAGEVRALARLRAFGFVETSEAGRWRLAGADAVAEFLANGLPRLRDRWQLREAPRLAKARQRLVVVSPKIEILGAGNDWLDFTLAFESGDGRPVPADEVRRMLRFGNRAGRGAFVVSLEHAELVAPLMEELDATAEHGRYRTDALTGEVVREIRRHLAGGRAPADESTPRIPLPATLTAVPRPYQERGIAWLGDRTGRFGAALLADDMGLGKTLQAIAWIESLWESEAGDSGLVLVVATATLLANWHAEFGKFAPGRRVRILHGPRRDAEKDAARPGDVLVTSYNTLARDLAWHLRREYRAVVLDEASLIRNPDTDHAKAVCKLRTKRRVALTGTPVENGLRDLWSIFRFLSPGWLGTREMFRDRYETAAGAGAPPAALIERLRLKLSPFLLRRTKEEVAPELPSKILIDEFCELSADQRALYRDLMAEGRKLVEGAADAGNRGAARMRMLTALLRLRQTCCDLALLGNERLAALPPERRSAKLQRLLELLAEALAGGHRVLVFSQFRTQLLEIEKAIAAAGWDCLRLDGQSTRRGELVERFQSADGPPVFLISLKAGGYGLNLTAADTVIHFDPWWNPAAEAQATDRAHRIGQSRPVTVYRLLTRGTVEEKVLRMQAAKRALAAAIDESGTTAAAGWSEDDLARLLAES